MEQETCTLGTKLIRGMGTFFKTCACTRQNRCPHPYGIRFRDATGQQREEGGYATQPDALDRLATLYNEKRATGPQQAVLKRETGKQRFGEYAASWLTRQRHYAPGSVRTINQLLDSQILPALESRRINTFSPTVVEDFITSMEEREAGLATQQNAFDTLKKILLDAHRRGGLSEDPFIGVVAPVYVPQQVTIPTLTELHALKAAASDGLRLVIDLMSGCGMRN
ncbi:MAG TPA: site-specific integrase, partial [Streptomyces sp.]|nr:site-specific integrase [Streptomyces sp.]